MRANVDDHEHQWIPYLPDAEGTFSKRGNDSDKLTCRGRVLRCAGIPCPDFLFIPHNPALTPVEAVAA